MCNLRLDDTNPDTEEAEFGDAIRGHRVARLHARSRCGTPPDYFDQLYEWAEHLITQGLAYVDDQDTEAISAGRGGYGKEGVEPLPRPLPEENLDLFRRMRAGEFEDGSRVLRAKIDMNAENMQLRNPVMYRIRRRHHFRTGDRWCIYPATGRTARATRSRA